MNNSFHGRTMATLSVTGQEKYHQGFQPMLPGVALVNFDDLEAVESAVNQQTVAVLVEPIQGEGGVVVPKSAKYLERLRELCDRHKLLLVFDEVQVGIGRTGKLFAHEHYGVKPDIMTLAKALGGGLAHWRDAGAPRSGRQPDSRHSWHHVWRQSGRLRRGTRGIGYYRQGTLAENATAIGNFLIEELRTIAKSTPRIVEVRGKGMIIGVVLKDEARPVVDACLKERLILNATAGNVLRLLPPLNLTLEQARKAWQPSAAPWPPSSFSARDFSVSGASRLPLACAGRYFHLDAPGGGCDAPESNASGSIR